MGKMERPDVVLCACMTWHLFENPDAVSECCCVMLLQGLNSAMALADFMRGIFAVQDCEERIYFLDCGRMGPRKSRW